jgi:hypothetical protein
MTAPLAIPGFTQASRGARAVEAVEAGGVRGTADGVGAETGRYARERLLRPINEETHGRVTVGSLRTRLEHRMATPVPRKRKTAVPQAERTVKTSIVMGASLHLQLAAAAAIAGKDRNALAVEILTEALRGLVVVDRRKTADRSVGKDRPALATDVNLDEQEAA